VVIATNPYGRILDFLDRSRYCFFQVAPQLYSRSCVDPKHKKVHTNKLIITKEDKRKTVFTSYTRHKRITRSTKSAVLCLHENIPFGVDGPELESGYSFASSAEVSYSSLYASTSPYVS
jgi:hypothetical protein